jgi:hypothetical protein
MENEKKLNVFSSGSAGTEIYGGYIYEEYLKELRGTKWADKADMMRRSDPIIRMILRALKLPLLSQNWFIEKKEESPEAEFQKLLFEKVIFEDLSESFTKLLAEILTFYEFGYSLFEKVHGVSYDSEIGLYNTITRLAYRSQRTIERFNVDKNGKLQSVYQEADGDTQRNIDLDARFLVHFSPEMEGDNYEGISCLRACYGAWLRKNEFLKLMAAGIEKYAIPTPILKVPAEKASSEEFDNAIEALECYTSNQSSYLTYPEGWELEISPVTFDSEKVRAIIDSENLEMTNANLVAFLLLGQGGGGSYSLSKDLSDFFSQTLQAAADHISEVFERHVMKDVLNLNRPGQKVLCALRCDNLRDSADQEFANTLKAFTDSGVVQKDKPLEEFVREKYKYPKKDEAIKIKDIQSEILTDSTKVDEPQEEKIQETALNGAQISSLVQIVQAVAGNILPRDSAIEIIKKAFQEDTAGAEKLLASSGLSFEIDKPEKTFSFAEKKSPKSAKRTQGLMDEMAEVIQELTKGSLLVMSGDFIASLEKAFDESRNIYQASMKVDDPSIANHAKILEYFATRYAIEAKKIQSPKKFSESVKLSEGKIDKLMEEFTDLVTQLEFNPSDSATRNKLKEIERRIVAEISGDMPSLQKNLSQIERDKIKARATVLLETQSSDVYKQLNLAAQTNETAWSQIQFNVNEAARVLPSSPIGVVGPDIFSSKTISDSVYDMRFEEESGIKSWSYVAEIDDVTTDLCQELDGTVVAVDDPALDEYMTPNHYNCRSFWSPNYDNTPITGMPRLSKSAQGQKTLSECGHDHLYSDLFNDSAKSLMLQLAEYQGRKVTLNKPFRTPKESKKFAVYTKNKDGNVVIVRFGDPDMKIKRDDPKRRKAFFDRFSCETITDKTTPGYWSCKAWDNETEWV